MSQDRLRSLIQAELPGLVEFRRELHKRPELSDHEHQTSKTIQSELSALGIAFKNGLGSKGTGIVAHIPPTDPKNAARPAVALRADIDALPITEGTGKPYASTCPGVMHACGHDGHITMLLGAARVLLKSERPNPVTLLFQPAEEHGGGADVMCRQGALRGASSGAIGSPVGRIYGLHGWPSLELGKIATRPGPLLAATDDFDVYIRGHGGHAAYPHLCKDPIVAGCAAVTALQTFASRAVAPHEAVVCTVGQFNAGTADNIIPDFARLSGTIRTLTPATRSLAKERFYQIVEQTAAAHGCRAEIVWRSGYPVTANDPDETERFCAIAAAAIGAGNVQRVEQPTMGGEDFAYYGQHVPACFFFLGLKPAGAARFPALHQPDFDFNDDAIPLGVELLSRAALGA
jgi:amidohydrolase